MLGFIFSFRGLLSFSFLLFLLFLIRDYPQWKSSQEINRQSNSQSNPQTNNAKTNQPTIKDISLAHYILVTPFAALYIVIRALFDALRYSLYYALWFFERSLPHLDDWLFETVTERLPRMVCQSHQWYAETGRPICVAVRTYLTQQTLPVLIDVVEASCMKLYWFGCKIQNLCQTGARAWKRLMEQNWAQWMEDVGSLVFGPSVAMVHALGRLAMLIYCGYCHLYLSIKTDLIWLAKHVPFESLFYRLARLFVLLRTALRWVIDYWPVPTLGLAFLVRAIDHLMLEKNTLYRIYRYMAPALVWVMTDVAQTGWDLLTVTGRMLNRWIYPAYRLFVKHVMPRLSAAYCRLRNQTVAFLWAYIYPTWNLIVPYLSKLHLLWPTVTFVQNWAHAVGLWALQWVPLIQTVAAQFFEILWVCADKVYKVLQAWLAKQAPILSLLLQRIYDYDWQEWRQTAVIMTYEVYWFVSEQSGLVYSSLERTLASWANEKKTQ